MEPFFHTITDRWVLIPTITVGHPKCECCDEGPVIVSIDFLCFAAGIAINPPENHA